jgi:hypothetical protein
MLLYDFSKTAIPTDAVDADWLTKPRKSTIGAIQRFILFIGPINSIFDDWSKPGFTEDSAIDDGHSWNAEKCWHENCTNRYGFSQIHRIIQ